MISSSFFVETRRERWLVALTLIATYFSCDQRQLQHVRSCHPGFREDAANRFRSLANHTVELAP